MAILIPNKEMPTRCMDCPCFSMIYMLCNASWEEGYGMGDYNGRPLHDYTIRQEWCPLKTITIDDIMTPICEDYCKHLGDYKDPDDLYNNECKNCELEQIMLNLLHES